MRSTDAYRDLLGMGQAIVTTREASALWHTGRRTTARRLRALEAGGFARQLRQGLWALESEIRPFAVAPYLTAPFPAYVSFWSALHHHGMIEQIPRQISVASLTRAQRIETGIGVYEIHQLAAELFGGFEGSLEAGYVARPEKALFDTVYIRAAGGSQAFFPELTIPSDLDEVQLNEWTTRITTPRLTTLVSRHLREALDHAFRDDLQVAYGPSSASGGA